jgi:hypothetical protein
MVRASGRQATEAEASQDEEERRERERERESEESSFAQPHVKINGPHYLEMVKKMMLKTLISSSAFGNVKRGITRVFQ